MMSEEQKAEANLEQNRSLIAPRIKNALPSFEKALLYSNSINLEDIDKYKLMVGVPQKGKETFYPRRKQKDNELNINKSILEQFNLLRVVDNKRYPAHFYVDNQKYILKIYKK